MGKGSGSCGRPSLALSSGSSTSLLAEAPLKKLPSWRSGVDVSSLPEDHPALLDVQKYPVNYNSDNMQYSVIQTAEGIEELQQILASPAITRIGLDIETTGGLTAWDGSIRLIQIGIEEPEPREYLIDAWAVDPYPVLESMQKNQPEILTCNGKYEQQHLFYRYGVKLDNLYDVQAVFEAINKARYPKRKKKPQKNFKALMRRYVDKAISKKQQNSGWNQPNLSPEQLKYAAMDVAGLLDIRRQIGLDVALSQTESAVEGQKYSVCNSALKTLATSGKVHSVHADRLVRVISHARSQEEVLQARKYAVQLPISFLQMKEIDSLVSQKLAELATV